MNGIREWGVRQGMLMVFPPPYSLFLNPMKELFSAWRWKVYNFWSTSLRMTVSACCNWRLRTEKTPLPPSPEGQNVFSVALYTIRCQYVLKEYVFSEAQEAVYQAPTGVSSSLHLLSESLLNVCWGQQPMCSSMKGYWWKSSSERWIFPQKDPIIIISYCTSSCLASGKQKTGLKVWYLNIKMLIAPNNLLASENIDAIHSLFLIGLGDMMIYIWFGDRKTPIVSY